MPSSEEGHEGPDVLKALPEWMNEPLETTISIYIDNVKKWNKIIAEREAMGKTLTQSKQAQYDKFCENSIRRMVFDLKSQKRVARPETSTPAHLRDSCITFDVHMSTSPELLAARAGTGSWFRLTVKQFSSSLRPADICDVPKQLMQPMQLCDQEDVPEENENDYVPEENDDEQYVEGGNRCLHIHILELLLV